MDVDEFVVPVYLFAIFAAFVLGFNVVYTFAFVTASIIVYFWAESMLEARVRRRRARENRDV